MTGLTRATMPHDGEVVLSMERMNAIEGDRHILGNVGDRAGRHGAAEKSRSASPRTA